MAKLSARGRYELKRFGKEVEKPITAETKNWDVIRERLYFAFMSDGHVLYQLKCWWLDGQTHLYPWKDKGKVGVEAFPRRYEALLAKGYQELSQ